jgi:hypothetical protein
MPVKKIAAPKVSAKAATKPALEVSYTYGTQQGKFGPYVGIKIVWSNGDGREDWLSISKKKAAAMLEVLTDKQFLADLKDLATK